MGTQWLITVKQSDTTTVRDEALLELITRFIATR